MGSLYVFGDSFVQGIVKESGYVGRTGIPEQADPFVEVLGRMLNLTTHNLGLRGASNWDIYQTLLQTKITPDDFVIVTWSGSTRNATYYNNQPIPQTMATRESMYETHNHLLSIGCEYRYLSSFEDYSKTVPMSKKYSDKWIWYNSSSPSVYDKCLEHSNITPMFENLGRLPHDTLSFTTESMMYSAHKESNRFVTQSKYIASCHHPTQLGHDLIAKLLYNELHEWINN